MSHIITELSTDLMGKINNLPHFYNEALLPVFEAVTNSIHAIEDHNSEERGYIEVRIKRESSLIDEGESKRFKAFEIVDNGIGFTEDNFKSFCTSDSTYKLKRGCKGIGRFLWLKAFDHVEVHSTYFENNEWYLRKIKLTKNGITSDDPINSNYTKNKTIVTLNDFEPNYYKQPTSYKTAKKIGQRIFEHCISYYISNSAPNIKVIDDNNVVELDQIYEKIKKNISIETILIKGIEFSINHIKLYETYNKLHNIVLCGNNREVKRYNISKIIGTSTQIDTGEEKFVYTVYVESIYLDENVNDTRLDFLFPEKAGGLLNTHYKLSLSEIQKEIEYRVIKYLKEYIDIIKKRKIEVVDDYIAKDNPTLRAVAKYCPEIYENIEPGDSKEKIDEVLYSYKGKAEMQLKKRSNKLLRTQTASIEELKDEFHDIEERIEGFQKDQLASYLIYRKIVIDLLSKKLDLNKDGKYSNEAIIHDIVFPRKNFSEDLAESEHNLWLIDEVLAFHSFAASDKPLNEMSTSASSERPDVVSFSEIDDDNIARSVSILEFKKPERKFFDEDPTKQLLRYVRQIRANKIKKPNGRVLLTNECTKYYCYAICDINDKIDEFAENGRYSKLKNDLGYYAYNEKLNSHIEILAFDKIVADAKKRHKIFFEKLGI